MLFKILLLTQHENGEPTSGLKVAFEGAGATVFDLSEARGR